MTGWRVHAWVLMGDHYHLFIETPEPNLVEGMNLKTGMGTTDDTDGTDKQGLASRVALTHWVSEFARIISRIFFHPCHPWSISSPFLG